jgi:hypothetical protein
MNLPIPSLEQECIIDQLIKNNNVLVDSVAGAGKTSTILLIAKKVPNKKILILTYNKRLKFETKHKIKQYNIQNAFVYSYHSFCNNMYNNECINDSGIKNIINNKTNPLKNCLDYDVMIIDEAQDMTMLYYELICKIYKDVTTINHNSLQLCIFGDKYQSIFQFNGSDERYIIHASTLFSLNNKPWTTVNLSISYRITIQMAIAINTLFLKTDRLGALKDIKNSINYVIDNTFAITETSFVCKTIKNLLIKYNYDDIFILCPSLKSLHIPPRQLCNCLSSLGYPVFLPGSDNEVVNEEMIKNKIAFSTLHQVKGLERKIVFVYNFDASFNKYYDKSSTNENDYIDPICPNVLYVAMTRATEKLYLIHHNSNQPLNFIDKTFTQYIDKQIAGSITKYLLPAHQSNINTGCSIKVFKLYPLTSSKDNEYITTTGITDFIKFLPMDILNLFYDSFTIKKITKPNKNNFIKLQTTSIQQNIYQGKDNQLVALSLNESVSNITGIAIPLYYETCCKRNLNKTSIGRYMMSQKARNVGLKDSKANEIRNIIVDRYINLIGTKTNTTSRLLDSAFFLQIANIYSACVSNSISTLNQITNYNWLPTPELELINKRMKKFLKVRKAKYYKFEHYVFYDFVDYNNKIISFNGSIDCLDLDNSIIYEFKCTNELIKEHYLQVVIYHYIYNKLKDKVWWLYIGNKVKVPNIPVPVKILYYDKNQIHFKKRNTDKTCIKVIKALDNDLIDGICKYNPKTISNDEGQQFTCRLFNALSNEVCQVSYEDERLKQLINVAIRYKYENNKKTNDEQFINLNMRIKEHYVVK